MRELNLPCPNSLIGEEDNVVVASVWGNDDPSDGPVFAIVLLLHDKSPFYSVAQVVPSSGTWVVYVEHGRVQNINEAVALYADSGGDV